MRGSAAGNSTRRKIDQREASSVNIIRMYSRSTEPRPSTVLTTIGKNVKSAMIASFGPMPKPITSTSTGARTTVGTLCEAIRIGYTARRSVAERCSRIPIPRPAPIAIANP